MKNSFILYNDLYNIIEELTDEEAGIIFRAILCYQNTGEIIEMPRDLRLLFLSIKGDLDRNNDKYEETCKKRRESGKKGGRPKKHLENEEADGSEKNLKKQMVSEKPDNDNVNDNVNANDNTNIVQEPADESLFLYLWGKYPNKKGKAQVSKKAKRALLAVGADEMERAIDRYVSELAKDSWRKPQNGSTFFNSGYVDYLDANYEPSKQKTGNAFLDLLQEGGNDTG